MESAKSLLAHFHLACKKFKPFEVDWLDKDKVTKFRTKFQLCDEDVEFLKDLTPDVNCNSRSMIRLMTSLNATPCVRFKPYMRTDSGTVPYFKRIITTDEYEERHYFTGQLFIPDWEPPYYLENPTTRANSE